MSCTNCSVSTKKLWVFGCGSFFCLLALIVGLLWPSIAFTMLHDKLVLTNGSLNYNNWIETPLPMYLEIRLFNWTNADQVHNHSVKPHFTELGPYVFLEKHKRVNLSWHPNNGTLAYNQIRTWHFVPELSNGTLEDEVTNINVMAASTAYNVRHSNILMRKAVNVLINKLAGHFIIRKTARELLFDGYDDKLLDFLKTLNMSKFHIPFDKFGWFAERNLSATYDGRYEINTGERDIRQMGSLRQWNNSNKTKYFHDECSMVRGTSGELWPIDMNAKGNITFFVSDVCRTLTLNYANDFERLGITGSKWLGDSRVFDNGQNYPPNSCYCTGVRSSCPDLLPGVQNMSDCRFGAPVFVSFPHFYLADPSYVNALDGVKPEAYLHEFYLALEPKTGIPLDIAARLQINILLQPIDGISIFNNVPKIMVPMFWFQQTIRLDEKLAKQAKLAIQLPYVGVYAAYGVFGLGFILLLVGCIVSITKRWNTYTDLDDELTR